MLIILCKHSSKICVALCIFTTIPCGLTIIGWHKNLFFVVMWWKRQYALFSLFFAAKSQILLTIWPFCGRFSVWKSYDEDTHFRKDFQRGIDFFGVTILKHHRRWYHFWAVGAEMPHRVRPLKRQWVAPSPVQPGWNRGILLYPTPDTFRGWEFFIPSPREIRDIIHWR